MSIAMSESYPRRTLRPLALVPLLGALTLGLALPVAPCSATGPTSVGCLLSEPEGYWPDIWLDAGAGRLYIADWPGARILIHDSSTLERVGEVTLASLLPGRPRQLAGHEGAGLVYAVVDRGWATSQSSVVVIDTRTLATRTLSNFGWHAAAQVDEQGRRLLVFANRGTYYRLTIVDVDTDVVVTTRDISALMNYSAQIGMGGLNPATGETVFLPNFDPGVPDRFALVNARTLAGEKVTAPESAGIWAYQTSSVWNWLENKIYITTNTWEGYFIHDRDTGASTVTSCINDASQLFFSPTTNRVYSGAEVDSKSTVIDGNSDACQDYRDIWGPVVGFVGATRRAFFVGGGVTVLDEESLAEVASFPSCIPPPAVHRPFGTQSVAVDQTAGRVFALIWGGDNDNAFGIIGPEADYACILVIEDRLPTRRVRRVLRPAGSGGAPPDR